MAVELPVHPAPTPAYEIEASRADALVAQLRKVAARADARVARGILVGSQDIAATGAPALRRIWVQCDEPVQLGCHVLVGKLEHKGLGLTLVRPLADRDLHGWRGAEARCEHCQTRRPRRETFLVERPDGHIVQVGRDCLLDYTGRQEGAAVALLRADLLLRLNGLLAMEARGRGRWAMRLELPAFVELAAEIEMTHGYLSSAEAQKTGAVSTAQRALAALREGQVVAVRPAAKSLARRALTWIRALHDSEDDFLVRLRDACSGEAISARQAALVCALLLAYRERKDHSGRSSHVPRVPDHRAAFCASLEALNAVSDLCGMLQRAWAGEDDMSSGLAIAKIDLALCSLLDLAAAANLDIGRPARERIGKSSA